MKPTDGIEYEKIVVRLLCERGYHARRMNGDNPHGMDAMVDGVECEIKGSVLHCLRHGRQGFAWLFVRAGKPRGVHGDIVILLAHRDDRDDLFIFPSSIVEDQNYIEITVTGDEFYSGSKLTLFHNGFDYLDEEIASTKEKEAA